MRGTTLSDAEGCAPHPLSARPRTSPAARCRGVRRLMKVQLVDPSAFTPPYDRSLAAALARQGIDVELLTSRFMYGPAPEAAGYRVAERFYRRIQSPPCAAP